MRKSIMATLFAGVLFATSACSDTGETGTPEETVDPIETVTQTEEATETETAEDETTAEETETESQEPETTEAETEESEDGEPDESYTLGFDGLPPYMLGDTDMVERGAMVLEPECNIYISNDEFATAGIYFDLEPGEGANENGKLVRISIRTPEDGSAPVETDQGAAPGMTFSEIKELYPDATSETKRGDGGPFTVWTLRQDGKELVFLNAAYSTDEIEDSQKVESIVLQEESESLHGSC